MINIINIYIVISDDLFIIFSTDDIGHKADKNINPMRRDNIKDDQIVILRNARAKKNIIITIIRYNNNAVESFIISLIVYCLFKFRVLILFLKFSMDLTN